VHPPGRLPAQCIALLRCQEGQSWIRRSASAWICRPDGDRLQSVVDTSHARSIHGGRVCRFMPTGVRTRCAESRRHVCSYEERHREIDPSRAVRVCATAHRSGTVRVSTLTSALQDTGPALQCCPGCRAPRDLAVEPKEPGPALRAAARQQTSRRRQNGTTDRIRERRNDQK